MTVAPYTLAFIEGHKKSTTILTQDRHFMVTPCINNIQHFNFQLTHTTLKNVELLKQFEISKTAPTCFGLQGNYHQGATISN